MIKTNKIIIPFLLLLQVALASCERNADLDKEKPVIDLSIQGAFPVNCDTIYLGEPFQFKVLFKDNEELGSEKAFSIDIHNNFNHHTHSTEVSSCMHHPDKEAINPLTFINNYNIPGGLSEYEANQSITLPGSDEKGIHDEGDYHFFIRLSDKEGWSALKGLSIKILHR